MFRTRLIHFTAALDRVLFSAEESVRKAQYPKTKQRLRFEEALVELTQMNPALPVRFGLVRALYGSPKEWQDVHAPWRDLVATDDFRHRPGLTPEQRTALAYERLRILDGRLESAVELAGDPARLAAMHEWTALVDGGLLIVSSIHYNLFLGSLLDHDPPGGVDSNDPRGRPDLAEYVGARPVGTFLCTELDHGNDAPALQTTATFDRTTGGFVLHTPTLGAAKFMPNTGPYGGAKVGLVAARLMIDGADHGVYLFRAPLVGIDGLVAGVTTEPLTEKSGSPVDHCLTTFDRVPLPGEAMLQGPHGRMTRDGAFTSELGSRLERMLRSIDRVTVGKLCMSGAAVGGARAAIAIAIRFSQQRAISAGRGDERVPVWAMRSHHGPLVSALASAYAMTALHRTAVERLTTSPPAEREAVARDVAITKGWITWQAREIVTECRERCGARGLFPANRLADLRADAEGLITAEGDNLAIWWKAAAEMLFGPTPAPAPDSSGRELVDPRFLVELLTAVEHLNLGRARARLSATPPAAGGGTGTTSAGASLARWNSATPHALRAVRAHAQRRAAAALLTAADEYPTENDGPSPLYDVLRLFAWECLAEHSGDLLNAGYLDGDHVAALPDAIEDGISALLPWVPDLINAFEIPEAVLSGIPIAGGRPNEGLTTPAKESAN